MSGEQAHEAERSDTTAAELIDALVAGAQPLEVGEFTLDREAAAAKLAAYRFVDRASYLVPLAEGLNLLGALELELDQRGADLIVHALGVELSDPQACLSSLQGRALDPSEHDPQLVRALERLRVAVDMALGHDAIERVALSYAKLTLVYAHEQAPRFVERESAIAGGLELLIDRPWSSRLSVSNPCEAELDYLREAVRFSEQLVRLDRRQLSGETRDWLSVYGGEGPGYRFQVALPDHEEPGLVELWSAGVRVDSSPLKGFGVEGVLQLDAPRYDLSGTKIIHDEVVRAGLEALERARERLVAGQVSRGSVHLDRSRGWLGLGLAFVFSLGTWLLCVNFILTAHAGAASEGFVISLLVCLAATAGLYALVIRPCAAMTTHRRPKQIARQLFTLLVPMILGQLYYILAS